jgi:aspartyl protease family protein
MFRSVLYMAGAAVAVAIYAPNFASQFLQQATASRPAPAAMNISAPERQTSYGGTTRISADRSGHYQIDVQINGRPVTALVDTGASLVVLRYEDARAMGLVYGSDRFNLGVQTANGVGHATRVKLSNVRLGSISLDDVDALVMEEGMLATNLLGMSFLKRLSRYEVRDGTLVLER